MICKWAYAGVPFPTVSGYQKGCLETLNSATSISQGFVDN